MDGDDPIVHRPFVRFAALLCRKMMWFAVMALLTGSAGAQSRALTRRPRVLPADPIAQEMLAVHNAIRANLKLPALTWSNALAEFSQKWANTLLASNRSAHNPNSPYGENILISGIGSTPSMVVNEWASESRYYSYPTNECRTNCGHYTQIVWRDTCEGRMCYCAWDPARSMGLQLRSAGKLSGRVALLGPDF